MNGVGIQELAILVFILGLVSLYVYLVSIILRKAGFSRWFSLLSIIPIVQLVCLWVFAFITWPIEKRRKERSRARHGT